MQIKNLITLRRFFLCSLQIRQGFTLIELLVVVLIIGILAAIALPKYRLAAEKTRINNMLPVLKAITDAQQRNILVHGVSSLDMDDLDVSISFEEKADGSDENVQRRRYTLLNGSGYINLYERATPFVVWSNGRGYTIDFWGYNNKSYNGSLGLCYANTASKFGDLGDKACAAVGEPTGKISVAGTPTYALR